MLTSTLVLAGLIFVAALLYSSVGHAGASGYLAAMALLSVAPEVMRPTALVLNILVATIATWRFMRAGHFSLALLWPFALGSIPLAFVGGALQLGGHWHKTLVGLVLLVAAWRLLRPASAVVADRTREVTRRLSVPVAVVLGAGIGLLSGLTGTGGGIFLSPLLIFASWAETRDTGGVSAAFILVNSVAGLLGNAPTTATFAPGLPLLATAAVVGGVIGSDLGARRIAPHTFRQLLGVVLIIAGGKLILV
ncbi:UPF0721 transmembrane protein [Luteitalea sp. TBR-22]|uniref:sulfite exporter TauE/SafE family protein n=1 Tax=Luteitalea sp. TBR-22 TaxID=2802971 RepID=UPI001AF65749|nr:sulfite exporter TauE/SafE family protein [Luteitalea sp. TBR-22]BCS32235.1 UPF0721 transmembrane protein [Luteitalea sp. TBR-22]